MTNLHWLEAFPVNCHKEFERWSVHFKQLWGVSSMKEGRRVAGLRLLQWERVTWGVNRRISWNVGQLTIKYWVWWEFMRASIVWGTRMVKVEPMVISSVVLTTRTVSGRALRQRGIPMLQGLVAGYNALLAKNGFPILGWTLQGHFLPFT